MIKLRGQSVRSISVEFTYITIEKLNMFQQF
jgi:hypothetical protein